MGFGTWNVRSLYKASSLAAAPRKLARYTCILDLVCVQEVSWEKGGTVRAGDYNFFYGKRNENHQMGTRFFVHHRILSAVLCIVLRICWCNIIVLDMHAPSEKKNDDSKESFMGN